MFSEPNLRPQFFCIVLSLLLAVSFGRQSVAACAEYSVDVVSLPFCGLPGYGIFPNGLSANGDITGVYNTCGGDASAFYWANGALTPFDVNSETFAVGNAVNSNLQIVGDKLGESGHVGFLYDNGIVTDIGPLPGTVIVEVHAINESGTVVGLSGGNKAFFWQDGVITQIQPSIGPSAEAHDINDSGQIVGWMGVAPWPPFNGQAFVWEDGVTTPLGFIPPATNSEARAISNSGHVCGMLAYPNPEGGPIIRQAFHWANGTMTELGVMPGFLRSFALDVNDEGTVVGYCDEGLPSRAFVWHSGVMTDLNKLIPAELEITLSMAKAINDNGQILCSGRDGNSANIAVLLTPIPSPIGDSNCDGNVDVDDLLKVINAWGDETPRGSSAMPPADFSHNHIVDVDDLLIVINNWN